MIQSPAVVPRVGIARAIGVGALDELVRDVGVSVFVPEADLEKFLDSEGYRVETRSTGRDRETGNGVCIIPVGDDVACRRRNADILNGREDEGRCWRLAPTLVLGRLVNAGIKMCSAVCHTWFMFPCGTSHPAIWIIYG